MADALSVHPAAVLVSALIFADLLGVLGIVIAAPMLATFVLIGRYVMRKMFDRDPWEESRTPRGGDTSAKFLEKLRALFGLLPFKREQAQVESDAVHPPEEEG